jgi:VWFA-related protein
MRPRIFCKTKMQPADLVALVSLGDTLKVDQDFTADKQALINEVGVYNGTEGEGFAAGATSNSNQVEDTTGYTPDESEYNDLNTDRELFALRAVAKSLEKITEKKSLLYFSGGISRDGIENQASLRSAINAAVRANLAIYSVDTRGLQAISPLGDASMGSLRGNGARNGGALGNNMNANFATQEVMATLHRHRRQGVLRFQRFCSGLCAGAARHLGLLRHRLPLARIRRATAAIAS